jgi:hypothetical protein
MTVKLPNATAAVVEDEKVHDYLLSPTHPVGRFKAVFFGMLGYAQEDWPALAQKLREIASLDASADAEFGRYGNKFRIAAIWPDHLGGPLRLSPPGSCFTVNPCPDS